MNLHPAASYWDRGVRNVPDMTGARDVMDCRDMTDHILPALGLTLPLRDVLDYGCGTGRLADISAGYVGVDITPSMVEYAQARGLDARLVAGPEDIPVLPYQIITCISVFTHVDAEERADLLRAFHRHAPMLLVDIIPGDGHGDVPLWTADPVEFERQLHECGWVRVCMFDRDWKATWETAIHRYYLCERRAL